MDCTGLNHWREVVGLPVVREPDPNWSLEELEAVLLDAHAACVERALVDSNNLIHVCLSGGLDSSLSVAMIRGLYSKYPIVSHTIVGSSKHPDLVAARTVAVQFNLLMVVSVPDDFAIQSARESLRELMGQQPSDGDVGVSLLYKRMVEERVCTVIAHDGIDELMGGYWQHRDALTPEGRLVVFRDLWFKLGAVHLEPLEEKARLNGITVLFPYLQRAVVEFISRIPLDDRTTAEETKKPLRALARKYGVPDAVITRQKRGFCDALMQI